MLTSISKREECRIYINDSKCNVRMGEIKLLIFQDPVHNSVSGTWALPYLTFMNSLPTGCLLQHYSYQIISIVKGNRLGRKGLFRHSKRTRTATKPVITLKERIPHSSTFLYLLAFLFRVRFFLKWQSQKRLLFLFYDCSAYHSELRIHQVDFVSDL